MARTAKPKKRLRRTAEQARQAILEATTHRFLSGGPEAIRLQDIATDVGVSHSTVLHHFGSRENLIEAFVARTTGQIHEELVAHLSAAQFSADQTFASRVERTGAALDQLHQLMEEKGFARILAWLILSGYGADRLANSGMAELGEATHEYRRRLAEKEGTAAPDMDDTRLLGTLSMITLLGDVLFGELARVGAGLGRDETSARKFRHWFAALLEAYKPPDPNTGR